MWAVVTTAFWSQIRIGEFLPTRKHNFDATVLPAWCNFELPNNTGTRLLFLPWTKKAGHKGETVIITCQSNDCDSIDALANHSRVNKVAPNMPICSYFNGKGQVIALTARKLLLVINLILECHCLPTVSGHCFQIGETMALLLKGVLPNVVKAVRFR